MAVVIAQKGPLSAFFWKLHDKQAVTRPNKMSDTVSFLNYPEPQEGPKVPYKNETQTIPVFRGTPLAISATM